MYNPEDTVSNIAMKGMQVTIESGSKAVITITKNLAALLLSLAKEVERTKGKISMSNLEKRFPNINTFNLPADKFMEFQKQARRYNILYSVVKPSFLDLLKGDKNDRIDIVLAEKDAQKLERIGEKLGWNQDILDTLTSTKYTSERITTKEGKEEEKLMVEIETFDKQGQKTKLKVPVEELENPTNKEFNKVYKKILDEVQFVDEKGVAQNISSVSLIDELDKFSQKEKKLEAGREDVIREINQEREVVKPAEKEKQMSEQENARRAELVERANRVKQEAKEQMAREVEYIKESEDYSEPEEREIEVKDQDISLTDKLDEIKKDDAQKKIEFGNQVERVKTPDKENVER